MCGALPPTLMECHKSLLFGYRDICYRDIWPFWYSGIKISDFGGSSQRGLKLTIDT